MKLPPILCGPILRRCDEQLVTVWIATSYALPDDASIRVEDVSRPHERAVSIQTTNEKRTVRAGEYLYIHLLLARPKKGKFPRGKLLAYEVILGGQERLNSRGLKLLYGRGPLKTTFFLQGEGQSIRLMHGSCRKPYGMGPDALATADSLISRNPTNLNVSVEERHNADKGRPAVLYLTGDQIYADDVQENVFEMVRTLALQIMDTDESLPESDATFQKVSKLTYGRVRRSYTLNDVHFTTEDGEGHLLSFGEYAAMYLMVWGPDVWDPAGLQKLPNQAWSFDTPGGRDNRKSGSRVRDMHRSLPAVRRALANVPTYMIFDDHDVTDDWNMHADWKKDVYRKPAGRRVVANALTAYWLFQGWGNDPDHFSATFIKTVQDYCDLIRERKGSDVYPNSPKCKDLVEMVWAYHEWHFAVPTFPPTIFADMRTERELFPAGTGPMLISLKALDKVAKLAKQVGYKSGSPLILVSSAPVFNIAGLDMGQTLMKENTWAIKTDLVDLDWEQWSNNPLKKAEFLRYIIENLQPTYCIFLSGEVHFGLSAAVDYYLDTPIIDLLKGRKVKHRSGRCCKFVQLTSSGLKNENSKAYDWFVKDGNRQLIPGIDTNQEKWTIFGTSKGPVTGTLAALSRVSTLSWVEIGKNIRDNHREAYAPIQARCNLGVVTIEPQSDRIVHELCLVLKIHEWSPEILETQMIVPSGLVSTLDPNAI